MSEPTRAYAFKPRTTFPIDVQKAGAELENLKGHNSGDLTPEAVVEAAKDPKSALHAAFEWDDSKAALQHRLTTAGLLIRSIVVVVTKSDGGDAKTVAVTVTEPTPQPAAKVVSPEELHAGRVKRGWAEIEAWHKQYGALPEFVGIAAALTGFIAMRDHATKTKAA